MPHLVWVNKPVWVRPAIIKYQGNKTKSSRPCHFSKAAIIGCLENECKGEESCIFVFRELSKTTWGICAIIWIADIAKSLPSPFTPIRKSTDSNQYLILFRTCNGSEIPTGSIICISQKMRGSGRAFPPMHSEIQDAENWNKNHHQRHIPAQ
jgi:hypothetical protein